MAELSLSEAADRFAVGSKKDSRAFSGVEVGRFIRWYGADRPLAQLRGHQISLYADVLGPATPDASRRADQVRAFLAFLKKDELTPSNLASHLRLRKTSRTNKARAVEVARSTEEATTLTREGLAALQAELEDLKGQRLVVREDIRLAMGDKDFKENSPLDAAKDRQGHIEARIRDLESILKRASVVEEGAQNGRVRVGSTVVVKDLSKDVLMRYTIVGPMESRAVEGKISSVSPVGKALLECGVGDEVQVSVPAGVIRFRVEEVEG